MAGRTSLTGNNVISYPLGKTEKEVRGCILSVLTITNKHR